MKVKLNFGGGRSTFLLCVKFYLHIYKQELFALLSIFYQLTLITTEL